MSDDLEFEMEFRTLSSNLSSVALETRDGKPDIITGYASVFYDGSPATEYSLGPDIKERIMPGAFDDVLRSGDDVLGLYNHDTNYVLGRSGAGTLRMHVDGKGFAYSIDPPATQFARDLKESIRRNDVPGSSFSFKATKETFARDGNFRIREIRAAKVYDVGPVAMPAYKGTTTQVSKRSLDALNAELPEDRAADSATFEPGDHVSWWDEDEDETTGIYYAYPRFGLIVNVSASGPIGVPGGAMSVIGTAANPALVVQCFCDMDDSDEDDGEMEEGDAGATYLPGYTFALLKANQVRKLDMGLPQNPPPPTPDSTEGLSGTPNGTRSFSSSAANRKLSLLKRKGR